MALIQEEGETLRAFNASFNKLALEIKDLQPDVVAEALKSSIRDKKPHQNLTNMLNKCKRHAATNDVVDAATKREKGAKAPDKKRTKQSDKFTKPNEKNKKEKSKKPATGKMRFLGPPAYPNPKAYHPRNKPSSEIMHIKRNDSLLVHPPLMHTHPHERNPRRF
ncbi:hypothetical protein NE237_017590 [Protea cynaroides]|uniref:Uncharacterized protein n=1 Tax=Protea cynaroides TaxID=273540 RepID=A0A9Q0K8A1_9MAGN|nr:hypothetical protein NE237_017590 [Protea cynaroides]